jgi:hypothetical protein
MQCRRVEENLSAYIDNQLDTEDRIHIEEHLRTCQKCSLSLEELKKTIACVQKLEDVEPPPWLTQKVMGRIKGQAKAEKGILRKLFYPLHIKIPVEILATLAIVVVAFYVFRSVEPEIKRMKKPSQEHAVITQDEQAESKADTFFEQKKVPDRVPEPLQQGLDKKGGIVSEEKQEKKPLSIKPEEEASAVYRTLDEESERKAEAPVAELKKFVETAEPHMVIIVYTHDIKVSLNEIEQTLQGFKGKIIKRESFKHKEIITAEIDTNKEQVLYEAMNHIGEIEKKEIQLKPREGMTKIQIEVMKSSEQLR